MNRALWLLLSQNFERQAVPVVDDAFSDRFQTAKHASMHLFSAAVAPRMPRHTLLLRRRKLKKCYDIPLCYSFPSFKVSGILISP